MNTKKAQDRKAKSAKEDRSNTLKSTVLQMHSTVAIV